MIAIRDLVKKYRTSEIETTALDKISFNLQQGEFCGIMGPSGCGKSTLLNVLGLLDSPTSGSFSFNGQSVEYLKEYQRTSIRKKYIGFIFQNFNLIDRLSVYQNIELPLLFDRSLSLATRKKRINSLLTKMHLEGRKNHYVHQLSGGQQQRVAIARALVTQPKILFADEPTGNLDSKTGEEIMTLLKELNLEGMTIVMVTHSEHDSSFCNRVINMLDGAFVFEKFKS